MKKIKQIAYKYRSLLFIILAVVIFSFIRNYEVSKKAFDKDKFRNLPIFSEQVLEDAKENTAFSNNEINDIDFNSRRDTDLLDTDNIMPESELEQAIVIVMAESQKLNIASKELEKNLIEAQKDINPDSFLMPINLSNLNSLKKSKNELKILQSSSKNYINVISNHLDKAEKAILKKIKNKEYADRVIKGMRKEIDLNLKFQNEIQKHHQAIENVIDFCIKAANSGSVQYVADEDNLLFTNDELVDDYNRLIEDMNKTIYAWQGAQAELLEHFKLKNQTIKEVFD